MAELVSVTIGIMALASFVVVADVVVAAAVVAVVVVVVVNKTDCYCYHDHWYHLLDQSFVYYD